jgi:hypothetical protein
MWSMINNLSVFAMMALVSLPVPGIAPYIASQLLKFTHLNILMASEWLAPKLSMFKSEAYPRGINLTFFRAGFESMSCLINL